MQENETERAGSTEEIGSEVTDVTAASESAENTENQTESAAVENDSTETPDAVDAETVAAQANDNTAETEPAQTSSEGPAEPEEEEEITYHAVQKEDSVTAIWEMQGRKHIRTIDPRSREGAEILRLFTAEEGEEAAAA